MAPNSTSSDLPPAYYTLTLSPEDLSVNIQSYDTDSLLGSSFDNKNARVIFTLKVLSIFLLQTVAVGITLVLFADHWIILRDDLRPLAVFAVVAYFITVLVMACMDQVKNRNVYNYVILVCYPCIVAFIINTLPIIFYEYYGEQTKLRTSLCCAWWSYIVAVCSTFFYSIFSLNSKQEFKLRSKMIIATLAFGASYLCITIPLYKAFDGPNPFIAFYITVFLYLYYLYVLYDLESMTGCDYRCALTPADYVTGAVNLQIDLLFSALHHMKRLLDCDDEDLNHG